MTSEIFKIRSKDQSSNLVLSFLNKEETGTNQKQFKLMSYAQVMLQKI